MENKNLKNILIAAGLAVFAGVLTLGVNAAFGSVDAPTQNPVDAALHSPRFQDVDVEDALNVGGDFTVSHGIYVGDAIKSLNGINENVEFGSGINVSGTSSGFYSVSSDPYTLEIDGNINLVNGDSLISNTASDANGTDLPVSILDNLDVSGNLTVSGKTKAVGIGDYKYVSSVAKTISNTNNNLTEQTVTCPANYRVVSCYTGVTSALSYNYANVGHVWGKHFTTTGNWINNTEDACTASVVTIQALDQTTATFRARAVCYNPNDFEAAD